MRDTNDDIGSAREKPDATHSHKHAGRRCSWRAKEAAWRVAVTEAAGADSWSEVEMKRLHHLFYTSGSHRSRGRLERHLGRKPLEFTPRLNHPTRRGGYFVKLTPKEAAGLPRIPGVRRSRIKRHEMMRTRSFMSGYPARH